MSIFLKLLVLTLTLSIISCKTKEEWKSRTIYFTIPDRFQRDDGSMKACDDLTDYCGGTFTALANNLNYIQSMGFDAVWITPPVDQTEGGYHGYWMKDLYNMNPKFGGNSGLKELSDALHQRGMWLMVDVVLNHTGYPLEDKTDTSDFSSIVQFNKREHYHFPKCIISDDDFKSMNTHNIENCWLYELPDLNTEDEYVRKELLHWTSWLINEYNIDGIRIDSVMQVPKDFWAEFQEAAKGTYTVGEIFDGRSEICASYQGNGILDATLNYPMHYTLKDVFKEKKSCFEIQKRIKEEASIFEDVDALATFVDNHDNPRMLADFPTDNAFKNAFVFTLFHKGIPIMYYGGEQGFNGGQEPANRETLWTDFDKNSEWYNFVSTAVNARVENKVWESEPNELWVSDRLYAFERNQVLVLVGNLYDEKQVETIPTNGHFKNGDILCNIFYPSDCIPVENTHIKVYLNYGETKVFVKSKEQDKVSPNTFQNKIAMDDFIMLSIGGKQMMIKFDSKNSTHSQLFNQINNNNGPQEKYTKDHGKIWGNNEKMWQNSGSYMSGKYF